MATSYNGWPASKDPKAIGINAAWAPLGHRFPGGVKSGDVETVLTYVVEQLDARVEPIDRDEVKDEWGYHFKFPANDPTPDDDEMSCHASGTAFDYNATRHPNRKRGTWTAEQRAAIRRILDEVEVVAWLALKVDGGDANRTPDEMHFEIKGTPAEVAAAAARLAQPPEDDMALSDQQAADLLSLTAATNSAIGEIRTHMESNTRTNEKIVALLEQIAANK